MSWIAGNVDEFPSIGKGKSSKKARGNAGKFSHAALSTAPGSLISGHRSSSDDSGVVMSEGLVRRHAGSAATDDILDRRSYSSGSASPSSVSASPSSGNASPSSGTASPRSGSCESPRSDGSPYSAETGRSPHSPRSGSSERRREERREREKEKKEKKLVSDAFDNYSLFQDSKDSAASSSYSVSAGNLRDTDLSSWSKEPSWVFDDGMYRDSREGLDIEEHQPYVSVLEYLIGLLKDLDRFDYAVMFTMVVLWCVAMFIISRYLPARIAG